VTASLTGPWRAAAADEGLRRRFTEPGFADDSWAAIEVPGHWRSNPAFTAHDGPVLYRHRFETERPEDDRRMWLTLDGIFYQGDVFLDGGYLGNTEGYFVPHGFEITDAARDRGEHVLAVEVTCARPGDRRAKRNITGVFQHWDCLDPDWNPGGIWRPVSLRATGPVSIRTLRVVCADANADRAVISVRATLDAAEAMTVPIRTTVGAVVEHVEDQQLAAGPNDVGWTVSVERPALWWPRALGDQPLYDVVIDVAGSDSATRRDGLRHVRMKRWTLSVNGERMFIKGSNHGPTRMALAEATPEELGRDVDLALDTGLDLLRLHAHITRPELYDAADERGLLLWQDFPLQWGYARGIRKQAGRQAQAAVDLLGHHPSIAVWCGHNEPLAVDGLPSAPRYVALQELPTWNKTLLDSTVKRALERCDGSRPVIAHSGVLPHPGSGGTDTHVYFGWYHGEERDFPAFCSTVPRMARFVSEFGAQAVPETDAFIDVERWPDLDWDHLGHTHALQRAQFDRYVPPAEYPTFASWREATQAYQADVIKHHIETLRRLKYRPTGGFCQFLFADGHPAVTWSVLDHARVPKQGLHALAAACAPVVVVADRPAASYAPGEPITLDVHVVSDLRHAIDDGVVTARATWVGGAQEWRWAGPVPADDCVRVGTIELAAPDTLGRLTIDLAFESADAKATNTYATDVRASTHAVR
jgi:beta-mannosidase